MSPPTAAALDAGIDSSKAHAEAVLSGLRELRARGRLCDVLLTTGGDDAAGPVHVAHQAVLAAASRLLRSYLVEEADAGACEAAKLGLCPAPRAQELRIDGLAQPGRAFGAALRHIYGQAPGEAPAAEEDFKDLARAWGLSSPAVLAEEVLAGLREMRAQGTLCDIVVTAGGSRYVAHQVVLAAASVPLRTYISDRVRELISEASSASSLFPAAAAAAPPPPAAIASHAVVLDLQGVAQGEALKIVLDFIYGGLGAGTLPLLPNAAVLQEVRQLATSLELPALQARAARWNVKAPLPCVRLPIAGARAAGAWLGQQQPSPPEVVKEPPSQASPTPMGESHAGEGGDDQEGEEEEEEEREEDEAEEAGEEPVDDKTTELERALYALRHMRFDSSDDVPASSALVEEPQSNRDRRMLERLREAFRERPVWLEVPLLKKLPASFDETTLTRLLPYVAYQWSDGPWQQGYTRFGWDPRDSENAEEAVALQVLPFRDMHWRPEDEKTPLDCTFRRPPSQKTQCYQLCDIADDLVKDFLSSCEPDGVCSKKNGWLAEWLPPALKDRLAFRSRTLRERAAQRASAAPRGRGGAQQQKRPRPSDWARGRGSGAGRMAKKLRSGGG